MPSAFVRLAVGPLLVLFFFLNPSPLGAQEPPQLPQIPDVKIGLPVPEPPPAGTPLPSPPPQQEPPRAKVWSASTGIGLSLTSGNTDTLNFNVSFETVRDPKNGNLLRLKGLHLRGRENDVLSVDRTTFEVYKSHQISPRMVVFGQVSYLRDRFKGIESLVAPTAGLGYRPIDTERTKFTLDAGAGAVWEKNPRQEGRGSGAFSASQVFEHRFSQGSAIRQSTTALVNAGDPADGLYTFSSRLTTKVASRLQLSVELVDTFKNKPPTAATQKNDIALITAITATF